MAIGTAAAILGSAAVGAIGSAVSGSKNSKAISQATNAQTDSNAQSLALQRQVYGENKSALSPYMERGNAAGSAINALLGLAPATAAPVAPTYAQPAAGGALAGYAAPTGYGGQMFDGGEQPYMVGGSDPRFGGAYTQPFVFNGGYAGAMQPQPAAAPVASVGGVPPQQQQADAFQAFRDSTGYQFRLGEGMNAINSGYAAGGTLQSGAALKALTRYGQDYGSNEFGNYLGLLSNQQGVGLSGASALAGVGQSYANNVTSLNAANAAAIGQGAVARANNSNAVIGGIGSALGGAFGYFGGSSYGR